MNARALTSSLVLAAVLACEAHAQTPIVQAYQELFAASQKEKRGLTFHVRGQTIGGAVVRVIGNDAVEIRNQQFGRIIIRLDSIDAVAMN